MGLVIIVAVFFYLFFKTMIGPGGISMRLLALDPGESTGWVSYNTETGIWEGGTIKLDRPGVWALLNSVRRWDVIIFETFQLYASHARTLIGNKFYTCEIIGIINLYGDLRLDTKCIEQGASIKKFSPAKTSDYVWQEFKGQGKVTNHTFDAYQHMCYYLKNKIKGPH